MTDRDLLKQALSESIVLGDETRIVYKDRIRCEWFLDGDWKEMPTDSFDLDTFAAALIRRVQSMSQPSSSCLLSGARGRWT